MDRLPNHTLESFKKAYEASNLSPLQSDEEAKEVALDLLDIMGGIAKIGVDQRLRQEDGQGEGGESAMPPG